VSGPDDRKTGEIFREGRAGGPIEVRLIPEFVGRLPVLATLEDLDEPALKRILLEPKNALVKQYQRLFEMESVNLSLAEEALGAIARRRSSARPGRAACARIMEVFCSTPCSICRASKASRKW